MLAEKAGVVMPRSAGHPRDSDSAFGSFYKINEDACQFFQTCLAGSNTPREYLASRGLGAEAVLLTGVNTNSCVLGTAFAANVRDFRTIVVTDCVDTMDGDALHEAGLTVIRTAVGWTWTAATRKSPSPAATVFILTLLAMRMRIRHNPTASTECVQA